MTTNFNVVVLRYDKDIQNNKYYITLATIPKGVTMVSKGLVEVEVRKNVYDAISTMFKGGIPKKRKEIK